VQSPTQVEILHQIITKIKSGTASLPRTFNTVIYGDHSYGSLLRNAFVAKYPTDVDALILTGYSSSFDLAIPGVALTALLVPAVLLEPTRFQCYSLGYLEMSTRTGFDFLFFWPGGYDSKLEAQNFAQRGTFATGEVATVAFTIQETEYQGPVYVVTGQHDAFFCNPLGLPLGTIDCESSTSGYLANTKSLYPAASSFEAYVVPDVGHFWQLHYSANADFGVVHSWMAGKGF
jgi:hypothetical protein